MAAKDAQSNVGSGGWHWAGVNGGSGEILEAAGAAAGVGFDWHTFDAVRMRERQASYIPKALYESIEQNKVALKGPVTTTDRPGGFAQST